MKTITIEGTARDEKNVKEIRREGNVPCNLYGGTENLLFYAPYNSFLNLVYTHEFQKVNLSVNGKEYSAILKDIQFHPVKDNIQHIDFLELVPEKKIITQIPLTLTGTPNGVTEGGKLIQKRRYIKVKCLPKDLVAEIVLDVTPLGVGKSAHVGELELENIEILDAPRLTIAIVATPRALRGEPLPEELEAAEAAAVEAAAEAAEGEGEGEGEEAKESAPAE